MLPSGGDDALSASAPTTERPAEPDPLYCDCLFRGSDSDRGGGVSSLGNMSCDVCLVELACDFCKVVATPVSGSSSPLLSGSLAEPSVVLDVLQSEGAIASVCACNTLPMSGWLDDESIGLATSAKLKN